RGGGCLGVGGGAGGWPAAWGSGRGVRRRPLHGGARGRLLRCLRDTRRRSRCPRARLRTQMVLLSHQGYSPQEIAAITRQSDETVRRWLHRFRRHGCPGLREEPRSGRPPKITPAVEQLLRDWALLSPRQLGVD